MPIIGCPTTMTAQYDPHTFTYTLVFIPQSFSHIYSVCMCIQNPSRNPAQSIICHHLKLNISMYYLTILIHICSDTDPTLHHI
jgi:hypothetical protein